MEISEELASIMRAMLDGKRVELRCEEPDEDGFESWSDWRRATIADLSCVGLLHVQFRVRPAAHEDMADWCLRENPYLNSDDLKIWCRALIAKCPFLTEVEL